MPVVFDSSFLIALFDPMVKGEGDIDTRIDFSNAGRSIRHG